MHLHKICTYTFAILQWLSKYNSLKINWFLRNMTSTFWQLIIIWLLIRFILLCFWLNARCTFSDKLDVARLNLSSDGVLCPALHGAVIPLRVKIELKQADCPVAHKLTRGKINKLLENIYIIFTLASNNFSIFSFLSLKSLNSAQIFTLLFMRGIITWWLLSSEYW